MQLERDSLPLPPTLCCPLLPSSINYRRRSSNSLLSYHSLSLSLSLHSSRCLLPLSPLLLLSSSPLSSPTAFLSSPTARLLSSLSSPTAATLKVNRGGGHHAPPKNRAAHTSGGAAPPTARRGSKLALAALASIFPFFSVSFPISCIFFGAAVAAAVGRCRGGAVAGRGGGSEPSDGPGGRLGGTGTLPAEAE